nr:GNAT family N-acetyltransferase [uncultured Vibrio sp.]
MNEYLELDLLTLKSISEDAGRPIDEFAYLSSLESAASDGLLFECRNESMLRGYFTLRELSPTRWFVPMFVVHPEHRNRAVFMSLFTQLARFVNSNNVEILVSNVLRNNRLSINFHQRLGFEVTRENDLGYEFQLKLTDSVRKRWRHLEKYC